MLCTSASLFSVFFSSKQWKTALCSHRAIPWLNKPSPSASPPPRLLLPTGLPCWSPSRGTEGLRAMLSACQLVLTQPRGWLGLVPAGHFRQSCPQAARLLLGMDEHGARPQRTTGIRGVLRACPGPICSGTAATICYPLLVPAPCARARRRTDGRTHPDSCTQGCPQTPRDRGVEKALAEAPLPPWLWEDDLAVVARP